MIASKPVAARDLSHIPFKMSIKPGMVVQYKSMDLHDDETPMALVLCPDWAVETHVVDMRNVEVKGERNHDPRRYLCAVMAPAEMHGAFELHVWRQVLVDIANMEREVLMEYDVATRFYHPNL